MPRVALGPKKDPPVLRTIKTILITENTDRIALKELIVTFFIIIKLIIIFFYKKIFELLLYLLSRKSHYILKKIKINIVPVGMARG